MRLGPTWSGPEPGKPTAAFIWGGFHVASNIDLPRLLPSSTKGDIRFLWLDKSSAELPPPSLRCSVHAVNGEVLEIAVGGNERLLSYEVGAVGTFAIRAPELLIEFVPHPGADAMLVEHALVNSILPIFAGLRSVLCLHAAAVAHGDQAVVVAGPTGVGKSTAAWRFIQQAGGKLLTDDAAVLGRGESGWMVYPCARTLRLQDASVGGSWAIRGKEEFFAPAAPEPVTLGCIRLLRPSPGKVSRASVQASVYRSLLELQSGWPWAGPRTRRNLERLTWRLAKEGRVFLGLE